MPDHHLQPFTEHIHWLPPYAPTDRPALGLITGRHETLLVDAGASAAHAGLLLDGVAAHHLRPPTLLHLTHWHWDHVFAGGSFAVPTFASRETRRIVTELAALPWDDAALDARVAEGTEIAFCRDMIRAELPDPNRAPAIRPPTIGFSGEVDLDLGGLTVTLAHVGGDHAANSSIVYAPDDGVAFLGDCLGSSIYGGPRRYTAANLLPLFDRLLGYDAAWYVLGHAPAPLPRAELTHLGRARAGPGRGAGSVWRGSRRRDRGGRRRPRRAAHRGRPGRPRSAAARAGGAGALMPAPPYKPTKGPLVVLGIMGLAPFAGVAWQTLHYLEGFRRLGYDVYYIEDTDVWPYDPEQNAITSDYSYTVRYLADLMAWRGLPDRWAYRVPGEPARFAGLSDHAVADLFRRAVGLVNLTGATVLHDAQLGVPVRIYLETDPVLPQVLLASGDAFTIARLGAHSHHFTYGENLGAADCGVPAPPLAYRPTRQPIILDWWPAPTADAGAAPPACFTTIGNWRQTGQDLPVEQAKPIPGANMTSS